MNAAFFALALSAAVSPSQLAVDFALTANRRPRAMLLCVLFGALAAAITIGLIDVLVIHSDVAKTRHSPGSAGDLAIGLAALAAGILLVTGLPRLGAAAAVGAVLGLPGAIYLTTLRNLNSGHFSTATRVAGVIVFCLFEFTLLIVPSVLLLVRPARAKTLLTRARDWMLKDGKRTLAYVALALGAYLTIRGLVSLLS